MRRELADVRQRQVPLTTENHRAQVPAAAQEARQIRRGKPMFPQEASQAGERFLLFRNLELPANAAGQMISDLAMPRNGGPRPIGRIFPNGVGGALTSQHTTLSPQVTFKIGQPHGAGNSTISRTDCGELSCRARSRRYSTASFRASNRLVLASSNESRWLCTPGISSSQQT